MEVWCTANTRVWTRSSCLVKLSISFYVILELLILSQKKFHPFFEPLLGIYCIILLILEVRLLLLPFSSLLLESEELLGLLGLSEGPLSIKILQLLFVAITFLIELSLELCISEVSL